MLLERHSTVMDVMQAPSVLGRIWDMYELPVDAWPWLADFGIDALRAQLRDRFGVADVSELCDLASEHGPVDVKLGQRMDRLRGGCPWRINIVFATSMRLTLVGGILIGRFWRSRRAQTTPVATMVYGLDRFFRPISGISM